MSGPPIRMRLGTLMWLIALFAAASIALVQQARLDRLGRAYATQKVLHRATMEAKIRADLRLERYEARGEFERSYREASARLPADQLAAMREEFEEREARLDARRRQISEEARARAQAYVERVEGRPIARTP